MFTKGQLFFVVGIAITVFICSYYLFTTVETSLSITSLMKSERNSLKLEIINADIDCIKKKMIVLSDSIKSEHNNLQIVIKAYECLKSEVKLLRKYKLAK